MEAVAGELATADRERTAAAEAIQSLEARLAQTQAALEEAVRCSEFNRAKACLRCVLCCLGVPLLCTCEYADE